MARNDLSQLTTPPAQASFPASRVGHRLKSGSAMAALGAGLPNGDVFIGAQEVVSFWAAAGPAMWFAKDPAFDLAFRDRFLTCHEAAARGELTGWAASAQGALALMLLLDQFPRNAFRDTPEMYATDLLARTIADLSIGAGHDQSVDQTLRMFFYLPFAHSEDPIDQDRSVALFRHLPAPGPEHAQRHRNIIRRFCRFPHRNAILGRKTTPKEAAYLKSGGYAG